MMQVRSFKVADNYMIYERQKINIYENQEHRHRLLKESNR